MKKTVTIYMADGEMRENGNLAKPYDKNMVEFQLRMTSWEKRWLQDQGYRVEIFHADQLDSIIKGIDEETHNRLLDIIEEMNFDHIIIDTEVIKAFNPIMEACQRCGGFWIKHLMSRPGQCPKCGSKVWDRPRGKNEPGPKPKARK